MPPDVFFSRFGPSINENPVLTCPRCDGESLTQKDVHGQIKGNFACKAGK